MERNEFATAKDFVIFKTGTWNGETFTDQDLDNMAKSYNQEEPPHIIIGHSSDYKGATLIPSWGKVKGTLKRVGHDLVAVGTDFNDLMAEWIRDGFFTDRSIELTKDNKRVLAIGMLGAMPPAVKKMPLMREVLSDVALQFSEFSEAKSIEFADAMPIDMMDKVGELAVGDTFKSLTEYCAKFLEGAEEKLRGEVSPEVLMQSVWDLQSEIVECLGLHTQFVKKIERMEENTETEYAQKLPGWKEFTEAIKNLFNKRKDADMDAVKEKEYQDKILALDTQVKEFTEKERVARETVAAAEAAAAVAAEQAKDDILKSEIKTFCDTAVKENRMTPAMRGDTEKPGDEQIMFSLGKVSADALKSFQQKYSKPIVPEGEIAGNAGLGEDTRPEVIKQAEAYVKANPKEFAGLQPDMRIKRAMFLHSQGKIKFAA